MKFNIRGENIEVTPALKEYVEKKLSKLERYFDTFPEIKVNLKVYSDKQRVEVTIPFTDLLLRAEETNSDMYAAIDLVVDKLERQIRKHKTKVNRKLREKGSVKTNFILPEAVAVLDAVEEDELELVRTKRFDLKPMDVEEAILQMDMLGHNFFVFTNADTNETNVVYGREDGKYGLIETK
ncbi:ribosome-associated translation inhibitor RaiA [Bacillus sp. S70]|uniref:ribosome hibernation-promoting factor, HPF/YfiA family n=1 Tax=unclassified Bacillus (in: firmicutes) TaxID=185979 RepID=UPI00190BB1C0|nr:MULTISPECIES: ribosome-associated translation inhibitor RaiA [unclassified Bacillus (in: firmicutes)]MBJ9981560.1 ribosome-associated translation inhibitor RaiA [Bacillus sp. S29]MBK0102013.1 ribosome-associated translation inhibitor RaiA [Bacillus sp. S70]MBK0107367.1 ribosome-associated translation inhibitor RaiA [Bacillus sp. S73]MBK0136277.1 ribosome-associated translation inhibitor RaiA [Bacillus sp. S72]MBK0146671.1 ribosome-associated translation inhibitor RaiA [Bacillus sp. S74]